MEDRSDADGSLAEAFWSVARRLRRQSREALAPWNLSPSQMRALMTLGRHGACRPGELSAHLHITPRSVTEVVDALEERGLVERRADPSDRRATLVSVTERGLGVVADVRRARAAGADRLFDVLDATERAELARLLGRLAEHPEAAD